MSSAAARWTDIAAGERVAVVGKGRGVWGCAARGLGFISAIGRDVCHHDWGCLGAGDDKMMLPD
jgi:hypothetical protein